MGKYCLCLFLWGCSNITKSCFKPKYITEVGYIQYCRNLRISYTSKHSLWHNAC